VLQADQDSSPVYNLAARTVAHLKARDSSEENMASDDRDEVSGPLRSAPGVDGVVDIDDAFEEEIKEQEGAWTHKVKREHLEQTKVSRFLWLAYNAISCSRRPVLLEDRPPLGLAGFLCFPTYLSP
jgi:hypothetical protein